MAYLNQSNQVEASVRIDDDRCGRCTVCSSVCPFDAISADSKTAEVKLDIEKCQTCGICSSACPASAIDTIYYNTDSLLKRINTLRRRNHSNTLVLTCRGSGPSQKVITNELEKMQLGNTVTVILPCVGRVPPDLLFKTLRMGINRLVVMPCEDQYCRFKDGSMIGTRRLLLVRDLLDQLGFEPGTLTVEKRSIKAHIDSSRCIGCGDCSYTCPYDAIKMGVPKVAELNPEACSGCGSCTAVCPALAIRLDGFEHESISQTIHDYSLMIPKIRKKTEKSAVLVLSCQWGEFSDFDPQQRGMLENAALIELPCAGTVDDLHVLEAFHSGFDGVLVGVCGKDQCKLKEGNEKAAQRIVSLKKLLAEVNLDERLETCFVSPRNLNDLNDKIRLFTEKLNSLQSNGVV
jgi:coenzyme F420-reducing hydrogenase delta subunit/NAD-dependent dihydropyrimidine dehydrogenase PreA subunit